MLGQLRLQRPLHQPLRQLSEHATGPDDLLLGAGTGKKPVEHLIRQPVPHPRRQLDRLAAGRLVG
jgi:hypothetical protein